MVGRTMTLILVMVMFGLHIKFDQCIVQKRWISQFQTMLPIYEFECPFALRKIVDFAKW